LVLHPDGAWSFSVGGRPAGHGKFGTYSDRKDEYYFLGETGGPAGFRRMVTYPGGKLIPLSEDGTPPVMFLLEKR
jgi:hypothetical protein